MIREQTGEEEVRVQRGKENNEERRDIIKREKFSVKERKKFKKWKNKRGGSC